MGLSLGLLKSQDPIRELGGDEVWQEEEREKGNQSRSDESVLLFSSSTPIQHSCRLVTRLGAISTKKP